MDAASPLAADLQYRRPMRRPPAARREDPTERQAEVLYWTARGEEAMGIARRLGLSEHTVRSHLRALREKWACHSSVEIVVVGFKRGELWFGGQRCADRCN